MIDNVSLIVQTTVLNDSNEIIRTIQTDYADVASKIELTTQRFDNPASLSFTCLEDSGIAISEGSSVELSVSGKKLFKGYVFTAERNREGEVSYTARDQLRYLKSNASHLFQNMTLPQIIQQVVKNFGLKVGEMEDPGYVFPYLDKENETCMDIIFDAVSQAIVQTGKIYNFYDDCGKLTLKEAKNMYIQTMIGDKSLVTDYTYKRDIDSDTYNRVKLVRKNEKSGRTDVYIHEDTDTIKTWGLLQYYDEVDENLNEAQIDEMCKQYLQYYNRVLQTITIDAIGIPGLRAGMIIPVKLGTIKELSVVRLMLTEKVTHTFEDGGHTMSIEVKDFSQLGGMSVV
ncbi:MAG: hypothetical protein V8S27_09200 [Lachnospiraceae bacterium]